MVYCTVFGVGFLLFGLVFATGRILPKIPGWAQLPEAEKQSVRILPLCRNIGGAIGLAGILLLAGGLVPAFGESGIRWAMLGWFGLCAADLVFIRKSGRYVSRRVNPVRTK